jgi:uncharacterized protein (DUF433 family)
LIDWRKYLVARREVAGGRLCAKGTRMPVAVILDSLAEGASSDEIIKSYPSLKTAHIRAAIAYAAALAREEELTCLSSDASFLQRDSRNAGKANKLRHQKAAAQDPSTSLVSCLINLSNKRQTDATSRLSF